MTSALAEQTQQLPPGSPTALDTHLLVGSWVNTNSSPAFIRNIQLKPGPAGLWMQVTGADSELPQSWGETEAQLFAENPGSGEAMALCAIFRLDGIDVRLQGYMVKGVLVIVSFTRVKDARERSSHFGKEFFFRLS